MMFASFQFLFFFPYSYTTMDINFSNTEIQIPHLPYTKLSFLNLYRSNSIQDNLTIWFRSARLWRRSRLLSWQEWVECGGLSRRQCIGDSESCEGSRLSLDGDRLVGSRCGRGAVRHLATGGVVWIRDQGARGRQVVVGVASEKRRKNYLIKLHLF